MGRVCVCCVVLCVAVCVLAGRGVHLYACGGRKVLKGPRKVDSLHTTRFFVFWTTAVSAGAATRRMLCALNARSNDCHVGLLCMTQRAQYRKYTWACTLCVVLRTDFSRCPVHFQATKLNCCERCSRVPVGADSLSLGAVSYTHLTLPTKRIV